MSVNSVQSSSSSSILDEAQGDGMSSTSGISGSRHGFLAENTTESLSLHVSRPPPLRPVSQQTPARASTDSATAAGALENRSSRASGRLTFGDGYAPTVPTTTATTTTVTTAAAAIAITTPASICSSAGPLTSPHELSASTTPHSLREMSTAPTEYVADLTGGSDASGCGASSPCAMLLEDIDGDVVYVPASAVVSPGAMITSFYTSASLAASLPCVTCSSFTDDNNSGHSGGKENMSSSIVGSEAAAAASIDNRTQLIAVHTSAQPQFAERGGDTAVTIVEQQKNGYAEDAEVAPLPKYRKEESQRHDGEGGRRREEEEATSTPVAKKSKTRRTKRRLPSSSSSPPPHPILATIPLDADKSTYEMLCTAGVAPGFVIFSPASTVKQESEEAASATASTSPSSLSSSAAAPYGVMMAMQGTSPQGQRLVSAEQLTREQRRLLRRAREEAGADVGTTTTASTALPHVDDFYCPEEDDEIYSGDLEHEDGDDDNEEDEEDEEEEEEEQDSTEALNSLQDSRKHHSCTDTLGLLQSSDVIHQDVDAVMDVLEEVQLCSVVPVLPRTFSTMQLAQQIVPSTVLIKGETCGFARVEERQDSMRGYTGVNSEADKHWQPKRKDEAECAGALHGSGSVAAVTPKQQEQTTHFLETLRCAHRRHLLRILFEATPDVNNSYDSGVVDRHQTRKAAAENHLDSMYNNEVLLMPPLPTMLDENNCGGGDTAVTVAGSSSSRRRRSRRSMDRDGRSEGDVRREASTFISMTPAGAAVELLGRAQRSYMSDLQAALVRRQQLWRRATHQPPAAPVTRVASTAHGKMSNETSASPPQRGRGMKAPAQLLPSPPAARSMHPHAVTVEWSSGNVGCTLDTAGLFTEEKVRVERTYYLPPMPCSLLWSASTDQQGSLHPVSHSSLPCHDSSGTDTVRYKPPPTTLREATLTQLCRLREFYRERSAYAHAASLSSSTAHVVGRESGPTSTSVWYGTHGLRGCQCYRCVQWASIFSQLVSLPLGAAIASTRGGGSRDTRVFPCGAPTGSAVRGGRRHRGGYAPASSIDASSMRAYVDHLHLASTLPSRRNKSPHEVVGTPVSPLLALPQLKLWFMGNGTFKRVFVPDDVDGHAKTVVERESGRKRERDHDGRGNVFSAKKEEAEMDGERRGARDRHRACDEQKKESTPHGKTLYSSFTRNTGRDWQWIDDAVLDELVLVALTPAGQPYHQRLVPPSTASCVLVTYAIAQLMDAYVNGVIPRSVPAVHREHAAGVERHPHEMKKEGEEGGVDEAATEREDKRTNRTGATRARRHLHSAQRAYTYACLTEMERLLSAEDLAVVHRQLRGALCPCTSDGTPNVLVELVADALNNNNNADDLSDISTEEKEEEEVSNSDCSGVTDELEDYLVALGVAAAVHTRHAIENARDQILEHTITALRPVLHRRIFIMYELLRLLSSRTVFMANRAQVYKYRDWYLSVPSPAAVLRLLQRSSRFGGAMQRKFQTYLVNQTFPSASSFAFSSSSVLNEETSSPPASPTAKDERAAAAGEKKVKGNANAEVAKPPRRVGRPSKRAPLPTTTAAANPSSSSSSSSVPPTATANTTSPSSPFLSHFASPEVAFVPESALLEADHLSRLSTWVRTTYHGGNNNNNSGSSNSTDGSSSALDSSAVSSSANSASNGSAVTFTEDSSLNTVLRALTREGRTMTIAELNSQSNVYVVHGFS